MFSISRDLRRLAVQLQEAQDSRTDGSSTKRSRRIRGDNGKIKKNKWAWAGGDPIKTYKCGQKPKGGGFCKMLLIAWAMEQGECKKFEVGGCYLEGGFDSEEECQRACKGQDYILWG